MESELKVNTFHIREQTFDIKFTKTSSIHHSQGMPVSAANSTEGTSRTGSTSSPLWLPSSDALDTPLQLGTLGILCGAQSEWALSSYFEFINRYLNFSAIMSNTSPKSLLVHQTITLSQKKSRQRPSSWKENCLSRKLPSAIVLDLYNWRSYFLISTYRTKNCVLLESSEIFSTSLLNG